MTTSNPFAGIVTAIHNFETSVVNWAASEEVVLTAVVAEVVNAVETIVTSLKPTAVADMKAILSALPKEFLSGATFDDIIEEVKKVAQADLQAVMSTAKPQVLEAIVGVLVNAITKL